jgi:hypothetical protein
LAFEHPQLGQRLFEPAVLKCHAEVRCQRFEQSDVGGQEAGHLTEVIRDDERADDARFAPQRHDDAVVQIRAAGQALDDLPCRLAVEDQASRRVVEQRLHLVQRLTAHLFHCPAC